MEVGDYLQRFEAAFRTGGTARRLEEDDGVLIDSVEAVGDDVVIRFRHKDRAETRFAYRMADVLRNGAPSDSPEGDVADIEIVFQEDVQPGYLLEAEGGGDTVTWFEMGHIGPVDRRPG